MRQAQAQAQTQDKEDQDKESQDKEDQDKEGQGKKDQDKKDQDRDLALMIVRFHVNAISNRKQRCPLSSVYLCSGLSSISRRSLHLWAKLSYSKDRFVSKYHSIYITTE